MVRVIFHSYLGTSARARRSFRVTRHDYFVLISFSGRVVYSWRRCQLAPITTLTVFRQKRLRVRAKQTVHGRVAISQEPTPSEQTIPRWWRTGKLMLTVSGRTSATCTAVVPRSSTLCLFRPFCALSRGVIMLCGKQSCRTLAPSDIGLWVGIARSTLHRRPKHVAATQVRNTLRLCCRGRRGGKYEATRKLAKKLALLRE